MATQALDSTSRRTQEATGTEIGTAAIPHTRAEVEPSYVKRIPQNHEKQNTAIIASVEDSIVDALNMEAF